MAYCEPLCGLGYKCFARTPWWRCREDRVVLAETCVSHTCFHHVLPTDGESLRDSLFKSSTVEHTHIDNCAILSPVFLSSQQYKYKMKRQQYPLPYTEKWGLHTPTHIEGQALREIYSRSISKKQECQASIPPMWETRKRARATLVASGHWPKKDK